MSQVRKYEYSKQPGRTRRPPRSKKEVNEKMDQAWTILFLNHILLNFS